MIKDWIIDWFCEKGIRRDELEKGGDKNYLENGFIDSLGFLDLISACEEKFGILFSDADFEDMRIFCIDGLAAAIQCKVQ